MGRFNFANGATVRIRVKRSARSVYSSQVLIPSYGEIPAVAASGAAWLGRVEVLDPPEGLTAITAAAAGGRARVTPRSDGRLTVNMLDHDGDASDLSISLTGTRDASPRTETLVVPVTPLQELQGQGKGLHPAPHMTGTEPVCYPSTHHRRIHVALDGFAKAEIEAREGIPFAGGPWLADNPALDSDTLDPAPTAGQKGYNPGGLHKYGETPELALDRSRARELAANGLPKATPRDRLRTVEIRLKAGDDATTQPVLDFNAGWSVGRGPLHSSIVTVYGEGARPIYNHAPAGAHRELHANWITHGFTIRDADLKLFHAPYSAISDMRFDNGNLVIQAARNSLPWGTTVQNYASLNNAGVPPGDGTGTWAEKPSHQTGIYVQAGHSTLLKDAFLFHTGWAAGYDPDIADNLPDPPEMWSQGVYMSGSVWAPASEGSTPVLSRDVTMANVMSTEAAANAAQLRPGGVILGGVYGRANSGLLIAGGPDFSTFVKDGNYSYAFGFVISGCAFKTTNTGNSPVTGMGLEITGLASVIDEPIIANIGDLHPPEIATTSYRPSSPAVTIRSVNGEPRTPRHMDGVVWGWTDSPTRNPNAVPPGDLDEISPTAWMDAQFPGGAPHSWEDFNDHCVASPVPWEIEAAFRTWSRAKAGYDVTDRTAADRFTFRPNATIPTPGCRWDIARDWEAGSFTGRLEHTIPGMVAGCTDSVDLDGHWVGNYLTLEALGDFDFGAGGHLHQVGGLLCITGEVSGSGTLETDQRGIVRLDGSAQDLAGIETIIGGRLENHGTLTGRADYDVHGYGEFLLGVDTADFTLPSGAALTLDGPLARAGWDGGSGGTATADFAAGSVVRIRPGIALEFSGYDNNLFLFVPGSTLTGATSGATARIGTFWHFDNSSQTAGTMYLDRVNGTFRLGEDLVGQRYDHFVPRDGRTIAQVSGITVMVPYIKKECFGGFGAAEPNVTADVTLGGAWEVDVTNIANGIHTLLDCDALAGRPSGFAAIGLGSDRNATLAIGAGTVTLTLGAGTGQAVLA